MLKSVLKTAIVWLAFGLAAAGSVTPARAGVAVAAPSATSLWISDLNGTLATVDITSGAVSQIGSLHVGTSSLVLSDIAFDPTGQLYGITNSALYKIDVTTAAATLVGPFYTPGSPVPSVANDKSINSLVFGTSGTLYAASNVLYTIDPLTGGVMTSASSGNSLSAPYISAGDLAFAAGKLYLSSTNFGIANLTTLDPATGFATSIGLSGATTFTNMQGLASPDNLHLYGVSGTNILAIDPSSGVTTLVASYGNQRAVGAALGAAFFQEAGASLVSGVPEPDTYAMLLAGLGLLLYAARRKRLKGLADA